MKVYGIKSDSFYNVKQKQSTTPNFKENMKFLRCDLNTRYNKELNGSFKKFVQYLKSVLKGKEKPETEPSTAKKISEAIDLPKPVESKLPKLPNGIIQRNGYEEHYNNGKIVKKVLLPEAYSEHTRIMDTTVEYVYNGDRLCQILKYDSVNGDEVLNKRIYTNLGDLSAEQIRNLQ